jgi:hypothetical protein
MDLVNHVTLDIVFQLVNVSLEEIIEDTEIFFHFIKKNTITFYIILKSLFL